MQSPTKQKIVVILGPTASGKSDLAVQMAKDFNGEVISADSRQVYKGLDIGTGKITKEEMKGVPHHLLDIADPKERFTVKNWVDAAKKCIDDISSRGKLPIICGGTGFYISALIDGVEFPEVEADPEEQKELESKPADELFRMLSELDPTRAAGMQNNGESMNKRRLARAILIARELGAVPSTKNGKGSKYDAILVGISIPDAELKQRIKTRLVKRIELGMIDEAKRLHENGLSFAKMDELGLEYRYLAMHLKRELTKDELIDTLSTKIWQYARRQKTWFKREPINWAKPSDAGEISRTIQKHLQ